jgi:hypothetical protein
MSSLATARPFPVHQPSLRPQTSWQRALPFDMIEAPATARR